MINIISKNDIAVVAIKPLATNIFDVRKGVYFGIRISSDNVLDSANFDWCIYTEEMYPLANGTVICSGADYEAWDNSNEMAFECALKSIPQIELL